METWPSVFAFFAMGSMAGFSCGAVMYFAAYFVSVRWSEFWTGSNK